MGVSMGPQGDPITYRSAVMPWQCDQMGHMNARHIYAAFDDATAVLMNMIGASFADVAGTGLCWADVRQEIEFVREVANGRSITVRSRLDRMGRSSLTFSHAMSDDADEVYARISIVSVRFDTAARKSVPIDEELRAVLRNLGTKEAA